MPVTLVKWWGREGGWCTCQAVNRPKSSPLNSGIFLFFKTCFCCNVDVILSTLTKRKIKTVKQSINRFYGEGTTIFIKRCNVISANKHTNCIYTRLKLSIFKLWVGFPHPDESARLNSPLKIAGRSGLGLTCVSKSGGKAFAGWKSWKTGVRGLLQPCNARWHGGFISAVLHKPHFTYLIHIQISFHKQSTVSTCGVLDYK